ncbi:MAG: hypothetical protein RLZZ511_1245 [Cyanobacteriota bacterium]|jgi:hypothetical protein
MVQTLQASKINMRTLIDQFQLQAVTEEQFFSEWQEDLPELSAAEEQFLDRVKQSYFNLVNYPPTLENAIKIAILGPMLSEAGFFLPPFHVQAEKSVEIMAEDEGTIVRGQIDVLLLKDEVWAAVIESKEVSFSVEAGLAQLLAYMLAAPDKQRPCYGMLTTGGTFIFTKLLHGSPPTYATSDQFDMRRRGNELYPVYAILKKLGQL